MRKSNPDSTKLKDQEERVLRIELERREREKLLQKWVCDNVNIKTKKFSFKGHAYLEEIYADTSDIIVIEKAVQMGASIFGVTKAMHRAAVFGEASTYFMPVKGLAFQFSGARVRDEIIMKSPKISALMDKKSIDAVQARRIGRGIINFRGMESPLDTQSDPADLVIIDEFDQVSNFQRIQEAFDRLSHSARKWKLLIGIPSIEDYGIDSWFRRSDQRYWHITCPQGHENVLEDTFPECLEERDGRVVRVCVTCTEELDCQHGHWEAKNPGSKIRGYHLSQLFSEYSDLAEILEQYHKSAVNETFWRQKLGKPFVSAENRLSLIELKACRRVYDEADLKNIRSTLNFMGVDTGKHQHYIIARKDGEEYRTLKIGYCEDFATLREEMDIYNIGTCVIDPGGNITSVKEFVEAFPGRAYACYYHANDKVYVDLNEADLDNGKIASVNAHRTATLDNSSNLIRGQRWIVNQDDPRFDEFAKHCMNSVKNKEEDSETEKIRYKYIRTGPDHWRHAQNYCMIAGEMGRDKGQSGRVSGALAKRQYGGMDAPERFQSKKEDQGGRQNRFRH